MLLLPTFETFQHSGMKSERFSSSSSSVDAWTHDPVRLDFISRIWSGVLREGKSVCCVVQQPWRSGFDSVEPVGGASYIVEELGPVWTWIWPKTETESCTGPDWSLLRTTWRKMIQAEEDRGTIWSEETRLQLYGHLTSGQRPPPGLTPYLLLTGVWLTHTADVGENLGPSWGGALPADVSCRTRRGAEMFSETTWSPVTPPLPPRAVILLLFKHRSRPTFSIPSRFW